MKRDKNNKMIAGVCSGIAKQMEIDPLFVRLIFSIMTLMGMGLPILIYILVWILTPAE